ncbi:MAG: N-acetyltransferase [Pseudomonadota bacterium]
MLEIRPETHGDAEAITTLTERAFASMPYSDGSEPRIIAALRAAGELTLSLVAISEGKLLGQITFSPVTVDGLHDQWFGLGPVSVAPEHQRSGVGSALINEGLAQMKSAGAKGIVLVGDPAYYGRFGFEGDVGLIYPGVESRYVQGLTIVPPERQGTVRYSDAFEKAARGEA